MTLPARFWEKVRKEPGGCWVWTGATKQGGYGRFNLSATEYRLAHRLAYEEAKGPILDGLCLDHLCRNPPCVNPAHLEPVTPGENLRRSPLVQARVQVTSCPRGHAYDEANTYRTKAGKRVCRTCNRDRARLAMRAKRAAAD